MSIVISIGGCVAARIGYSVTISVVPNVNIPPN